MLSISVKPADMMPWAFRREVEKRLKGGPSKVRMFPDDCAENALKFALRSGIGAEVWRGDILLAEIVRAGETDKRRAVAQITWAGGQWL